MADPQTDLARERYRRGSVAPFAPDWRSPGSPAMVGVVATPATAGQFMTVHPAAVNGTETVGSGAAIVADASALVPVYLAGPGAPGAGEAVLCRFVAHRWVNDHKGSPCLPLTYTLTNACGGGAVSGATMTVTDGTTTLTATTNGSGVASVTPPYAATWTVAFSKPGFTSAAAASGWTCAGGTVGSRSLAFSPPSSSLSPSVSPIYLTTAGNTFTLPGVFSSGVYNWSVVGTVAAAGRDSLCATTSTVDLNFQVTYNPGTTCTIVSYTVRFNPCACAPYDVQGSGSSDSVVGSGSITAGPPWGFSGTWNSSRIFIGRAGCRPTNGSAPPLAGVSYTGTM